MHHCDHLRPEKASLRKGNSGIILLSCNCIDGINFYYSFRRFIHHLMPMCVPQYSTNSINMNSVKKQGSAWPLPSEFDFGPHV